MLSSTQIDQLPCPLGGEKLVSLLNKKFRYSFSSSGCGFTQYTREWFGINLSYKIHPTENEDHSSLFYYMLLSTSFAVAEQE